jgi:hypothetical protein
MATSRVVTESLQPIQKVGYGHGYCQTRANSAVSLWRAYVRAFHKGSGIDQVDLYLTPTRLGNCQVIFAISYPTYSFNYTLHTAAKATTPADTTPADTTPSTGTTAKPALEPAAMMLLLTVRRLFGGSASYLRSILAFTTCSATATATVTHIERGTRTGRYLELGCISLLLRHSWCLSRLWTSRRLCKPTSSRTWWHRSRPWLRSYWCWCRCRC